MRGVERTELAPVLATLMLSVLVSAVGCRGLRGVPGVPSADLAESRPLREWVHGPPDAWQEPLQLTTHPAEDSNADLSADGRWLAFVSNRNGGADIWLKRVGGGALTPPAALTDHPSVDAWPRWAPDGERIAFTSRRADAAGDIWIAHRDGFDREELKRVTDAETADAEPAWFPDGRTLAFTASSGIEQSGLYRKTIDGKTKRRLTRGGGFSPNVSPDGRYVAFIRTGDESGGAVWLLDVQNEAAFALTAGTALDAFPSWSEDGSRIVFVRFGQDTDGDGKITVRDTASLWTVPVDRSVLEQKAPVPAFPLTSARYSELFPSITQGVLLFTSNRGQGLDVWVLPEWGELPRFETLSRYVAFAEKMADNGSEGPYRRILALRAVTQGAELPQLIQFDLSSMRPVAEAQLRIGRIFLDLGKEKQAEKEFARAVQKYDENPVVVGMAKLELIRLRRRRLLRQKLPLGELKRSLADDVDRLEALRQDYTVPAGENAAAAPAGRVTKRTVAAEALVELIRTSVALHQYSRSLEMITELLEKYGEQREACAQALMLRAETYRVLGEPKAVTDAYLAVLRQYGDLTEYKQKATGTLLSTIVGEELESQQKLEMLRRIVEQYEKLPYLQAMAQNRIGDLFYEGRDFGNARIEYRRTIQRWPDQLDAVARAHLALAHLYYRQQNYEESVAQYRKVLETHDEYKDTIYYLARRDYLNRTMEKASREMDLGDPRLAAATYARLIKDFDAGNVRAHRGWVDSLARLDQLDRAVNQYREQLRKDPKDHVAAYSLARAYSYMGPSDWVGTEGKAELRRQWDRQAVKLVQRALLLKAQIPYYHQLLGFLYERLARATGDSEEKSQYQSLALDAYITALSLSDPKADPTNHADLVLNVAEGFRLVGNQSKAYEYYRQALGQRLDIRSDQRKTLVHSHTGQSAIAVENYDFAAEQIGKALRVLQDQPAPQTPEERRQFLIRIALLRDQLALSHRLGTRYREAVEEYRSYLDVLEQLAKLATTSEQQQRYAQNRLRAQRNLALNLYRAVEAGSMDQQVLVEARRILHRVLEDLPKVGVVQNGEAGRATITIELGGGTEFDETAELQLVHTYLARIYALADNYAEAAAHLQKKLDLYEEPKDDNALAAEHAIVVSQIGMFQLKDDKPAAAFKSFQKARELDQKARNLHGEVVNTANMGSAVLRMLAGRKASQRSESLRVMLADAISAHSETLGKLEPGATEEQRPAYVQSEYEARLRALHGKLVSLQ